MKKPRWRKILKVSKPLIREQVSRLQVLELWHAVGFGSCDYREEECWATLDGIFDLFIRSVPKAVLIDPAFVDYKKNPEFCDLQEHTDRSFEEEAE